MSGSPLEDLIAAALESPAGARILDALADRIAERLRGGVSAELQSQDGSPLGRRHNATVRRRIAQGQGGASIVGRAHYLTREALTEELRLQAPAAAPKPEPAASHVRAELERKLRAVR